MGQADRGQRLGPPRNGQGGQAPDHTGTQGTLGPQGPNSIAASLIPGPYRDWMDRGTDTASAPVGSAVQPA